MTLMYAADINASRFELNVCGKETQPSRKWLKR
jgi:hypothetical protein